GSTRTDRRSYGCRRSRRARRFNRRRPRPARRPSLRRCLGHGAGDVAGASDQLRAQSGLHQHRQLTTDNGRWTSNMNTPFDIIAFDADDTLWHNETLFSMTQDKFRRLLARYEGAELALEKLYETEVSNLEIFGYGIKGFTLSMIETAIELTQGRVAGQEIQQI